MKQGRAFPQGEVILVQPVAAERPLPRRPWLFAAALALSAALAALVGIVLGLLAALEWVPPSRWTGAVQAHADIQLSGWVAVFIVALAFEFVVRLHQSRPLPEGARVAAFVLMAAGALAQAGGQLFHPEVGWLWLPGAVVSLVGVAIAAWLVIRVRPGFAPGSRSYALWLRLAMSWLVVAAAAAVVASSRGTAGVMKTADLELVSEIFIRGFVTGAIVSIALRAFPGHLGLAPVSTGRQRLALGLLQLSLVAWALASGALGLPRSAAVQRLADLLLAADLLLITYWLGVIPAFRFDWSLPRYRLFIPWAWGGLVLYAAALALVAVLPGWEARTLYERGAVRHLYLLAFMAPLMVAMAHIVLERFGTGVIPAPQALLGAFLSLQVAWPLRVIPAFAGDPPGDLARLLMGVGGFFAVLGLGLLAFAAAEAARQLARRQRWTALPPGSAQP